MILLFARQIIFFLHSSLNGSVRRRRSRRLTEQSEKENTKETEERQDKSKLIDVEEAASGSVGIAVYIRYFKSIGVFLCFAAVASNAVNQAASVYANSMLLNKNCLGHSKTKKKLKN